MESDLVLSKFVVWLRVDDSVVLWNRILGGYRIVSSEQFNILRKDFVGNTILNDDEINHLKEVNILVAKSFSEEENLSRKSKELVFDSVNSKKLRCLELSVSEHCNYKCVYCTFWRNKNSFAQKYLSIDIAEKAIRDFLKLTEKQPRVLVYFGTAEPLLNWDVIYHITPVIREIRSDVTLSLITNSSLITHEKLKYCQKHKIKVGLSLDGMPERQRAQRIPILNDIDSSDVVLAALKLGNEIDFRFSCLSATFRDTGFKDDIDYLISICKQYGIKEFDLDFDIGSLGFVDVAVLIEELLYGYKEAGKNDLSIFGYWLIPFFNIIDNSSKIKSFCGNVVGESVCVSSSGGFKLCGYEGNNMFTYLSLEEHLGSKKFKAICETRMPKSNPLCKDCIIEGLCNGHCMLIEEKSETWLQTCDFYKKVTKKLLSSYIL
ncbi:radical SAM protein [Candidatus Parcubacteria bacterium]|nr:radical SAM protein [Candidatus Parcubacteria bacterium]